MIESLNAELLVVENLVLDFANISENIKTVIIKCPPSLSLKINDNWKTILLSIIENLPSSIQIFFYFQYPLHQIDSLELSSKDLYDYLGIRSFIVPN